MATMRGKKLPQAKREQVKALLYLNPDISERDIAKTVEIGNGTAHKYKKELMQTDEFEQVRAAKKQEFINEAWNVVQKALKLADKRFSKALDDEAAIEKIINTIKHDDLTQAQKKSLVSRLNGLQMTNIRDISVALGTIYDKQALASGEPTTISESKEPLEELIAKYEENAQKLKKLVNQ